MKNTRLGIAVAALLVTAPARAQEFNFAEQLAEGGAAIVVILAMSVLALAVVFERLIHFRRKYIVPAGLADQARELWSAGDTASLQGTLADDPSTLARAIEYMAQHRTEDFARISSGVGDTVSLELRRHQQKAYPLAIVATVAPIVGLLGTVVGMIEAFHVIATANAMGDPALLAGGISKALINTASGLAVALPALGLHHFFKHRAVFLSLDLEQQINALMDEWFTSKVAKPAPLRHAN